MALCALALAAGCAEAPGDPDPVLRRLLRERPVADAPPPVFDQQAEVWLGSPPAPAVETAQSRTRQPERRVFTLAVGLGTGEVFGNDFEAAFEQTFEDLDISRGRTSDRDAVELVQLGRMEAAIIAGELSQRDVHAGLRQTPIGVEIFCLAVDARAKVHNLGRDQVRDLLTGRTGHWSRLGCEGGSVVVVVPGSPETAERAARILIPGDPLTGNCVQADGDDRAFEHLLRMQGAVGIVRLAALQRAARVRPLTIDTVAPSREAFTAGTYPFGTRVLLVTSGQVTGAALRILEFARSEAGRQLLGRRLTLP